ncbi:collagen alpha-1(xii) chain-like [Plakobranchus ocellatus]|uniref:Collagen alpha-1(Xii) chain-like n=1 Tax=Plakobranchus ocellatus TaxID=259542 RepID=A0AAV4BWL7_9GAST|nr:collagen alpha-1(xii) chain-like [Plakobranchus ocellatus]
MLSNSCVSRTKTVTNVLLQSSVPVLPGCGLQPADILFIVDASGSVTAPNFNKTLQFIENMVNGFVVGPNDTQIGMVTFDTKPYLQFHLNKFNTKQARSGDTR